MARKTKRKASSSASTKTTQNPHRRGAAAGHSNAFYNDLLGIAGALLRRRQEQGAEKISALAGATRSVAAELPDVPHVQTYVTATADQIDLLADYFATNSIEQMVEDGTALARRHPFAALSLAIAAGYGLTRFVANQNQSSRTGGVRRTRGATFRKSRSRTGARTRANGRDQSHESANAA